LNTFVYFDFSNLLKGIGKGIVQLHTKTDLNNFEQQSNYNLTLIGHLLMGQGISFEIPSVV
jgi:hypothetical protein